MDTATYTNGIKPGTRVSWSSQAAGSFAIKEGTVIYVGPPGAFVDLVAPSNRQYWGTDEFFQEFKDTMVNAKSRLMTDRCSTGVIVRVDKKKLSRSPEMKLLKHPIYYSPYKSKLEHVAT